LAPAGREIPLYQGEEHGRWPGWNPKPRAKLDVYRAVIEDPNRALIQPEQEIEAQAAERAPRDWCEENSIEVVG
jgi:hypothetical protein